MLVYHPVYDAYHCVFRLLSILEARSSIDVEALRILDFVLCFPSVVADFRLPPGNQSIKKSAKESHNLYRAPLNARAMFVSLKGVHDGAITCLAAAGFISQDELERGRAVRTGLSLPADMTERYLNLKAKEGFFFEGLMAVLLAMPLYGEGGLKDRSGLMEYRYDLVAAKSSVA